MQSFCRAAALEENEIHQKRQIPQKTCLWKMTISEGGKRLISELHSLLVQAQPEPPVAWPHHRFYHLGPNLSIWRLLCNRRFYIWGQNNSDAQSSTEQSSSHAAIKLYVSSDQTVSKDPVTTPGWSPLSVPPHRRSTATKTSNQRRTHSVFYFTVKQLGQKTGFSRTATEQD